MRYPDGGGLTAAGRARREEVRLQAAEWFAEGVTPPEVARRLRVSSNSAYAWRRRWRAGGEAALASRGPGGAVCRLGEAQLARLRAALDGGPAAWGWGEDQRWTLDRVAALIGRRSVSGTRCGAPRTCCTASGTPRRSRCTGPPSAMRRRSPRGGPRPGRRYEASGGERSVDLLRGRGRAEPAPAKARTWARRGHTPVVTVCGKGSGRVSVAGLVCLRPGARGQSERQGPPPRGSKPIRSVGRPTPD